MLRSEDQTAKLINRIERVENKVDAIEDKVNILLEQGEVTQENVNSLTDSLNEQRDHFSFVRKTLMVELKRYQRVFAVGSFVLVLLLLWILLRL